MVNRVNMKIYRRFISSSALNCHFRTPDGRNRKKTYATRIDFTQFAASLTNSGRFSGKIITPRCIFLSLMKISGWLHISLYTPDKFKLETAVDRLQAR